MKFGKYMTVGVDPKMPARSLVIYVDGKPEIDYPVGVTATPKMTAYIELEPYAGKKIEYKLVPPYPAAQIGTTDELPLEKLYSAPDRPKVHFTPPFGQMNDPNGLVYYEGRWHAFYQKFSGAPNVIFDTFWPHHGWGHIVSDDLLHWEDWGMALPHCPLGSAFSGTAIVDTKNVTGLKVNEHDPLLLYYTAAGSPTMVSGGKFCQRMAYSVDGGKTFVRYPKVIVDNIASIKDPNNPASNRDPSVKWVEELGKYVLVLYNGRTDLPDYGYYLYVSDNLLDWQYLQRIEFTNDWECPDLFDITASDGERLWVLTGAKHTYKVGRFTGKGFVEIQPDKTLIGKGITGYASQSFAGTDERIHIDWLRIPYETGSEYFGCFGVPSRYGLKKTDEGYILTDYPIDLTPIVAETKTLSATNETAACKVKPGAAHIIELDADLSGGSLTLDAFGIPLVFTEGRVTLCKSEFRSVAGGKVRAKIIYDVRSIEAYFDDGEIGITIACDCNLDDPTVTLVADNASATAKIERLNPTVPIKPAK